MGESTRFSQYLGNSEILVSTNHGFNLIVPGWDVSLTPHILATGTWEARLTCYMENLIEPGCTFFDVGANLGWFSSLMAKRGCIVHAFEPNPNLQQVLKKNIQINAGGNTLRSRVNQCIVGEEPAIHSMQFPKLLAGGANIYNHDVSDWLDELTEAIDVECITLDSYSSVNSIDKVDFIKMDIEGYEEKAMIGSSDLIERSLGCKVSLEYTRGRYSESFPQWLFSRFHKAYCPTFEVEISLKTLLEYEAGKFLPDAPFLDIVFFS